MGRHCCMALLCCRARPQGLRGACSRCGCLGSRQLAAGWRNGSQIARLPASQAGLARSQGALRIRQFAGTNSTARPIRLGANQLARPSATASSATAHAAAPIPPRSHLILTISQASYNHLATTPPLPTLFPFFLNFILVSCPSFAVVTQSFAFICCPFGLCFVGSCSRREIDASFFSHRPDLGIIRVSAKACLPLPGQAAARWPWAP